MHKVGKCKIKIEIWGKAHREAARRHKSIGGNFWAEIFPAVTPHSLNAVALIYTSRALSVLQCSHRPTGMPPCREWKYVAGYPV